MKKLVVVFGVLIAILLVGVGVFLFLPVKKPRPVAKAPEPGLTAPGVKVDSPPAPASAVQRRAIVLPTPPPVEKPPAMPVAFKNYAPMRVFTSTAPDEPAPCTTTAAPEEDRILAPFGMQVKARTVGAVVSNAVGKTPIIGEVTDSLIWNGVTVIGRCSTVHGMAQLSNSRDRIASEGVFTIVLFDEAHPGKISEMEVQGMVLDREEDPNLQTYGILNRSSGIRGDMITNDNLALVKLFAASFFSGAGQAVQATVPTLLGNTSNPNGKGAGGISGAIINPLGNGTSAVMDQYAAMILDAIHRDGVYIQVPKDKQFYLYILQDIKAPRGSDEERERVQGDYLRKRRQEEDLTAPRDVRETREERDAQNPLSGLQSASQTADPALEQARARHEAQQRAFQSKAEELKTIPTASK
jgi:hypothetical protein